ncbi:alpha-L-fucosidase [Flavihumibacter petaseus]|uniref:alpha-L-fucosidase n=1 Tax=Flavihumibacter petaseus NBRC 106054 TaxID=1220578 RepID=A0A0E9MXL7_9BACT|nr:alpha-L-fucosidase [Flavihumibacter petaseus]GAO42447.1 putative glycosidase [Flavihumibacter petaseus NBRC 106054]
MKKMLTILLGAGSLFAITPVFAQPKNSYQPTDANQAARETFRKDRFGMFIHWGASSVLGAGEWVMNDRNIKVKDYQKLRQLFNPEQFDAAKWVSTAKNAGMKYITFITRHHDGFSNWDTKYSDWKITNTPYGRDVLKELSAECQKQGIQLFLYYSLLDWYRTDYQYWTGRTGQGTGRTEKGKWDDYVQFMKNQLTELLTNYGPIAGIWFDGHWDQVGFNEETKQWDGKSKVDWHYDEIYQLIHQLQPKALVGNNHHLSTISGEDFQMFEKDLPGHNTTGWGTDVNSISDLPLETCETINNSWGFNITDGSYKSTKTIVQLLAKDAGLDANLLLNIGPMPNGVIQPEFVNVLDSVGQWLTKNGESIYGTRGAGTGLQSWGTATKKDNVLYIHLLDPAADTVSIANLPFKKVKSAILLATGAVVQNVILKKGQLHLSGLKSLEHDPNDTVIKINF